MADIPPLQGLDKTIHERARLGIVASLAARKTMTFSELKESLGMTDGNLSVHARILEKVGYITISKKFVGRKPRTTMGLTAKGQRAFRAYVDCLERIVAPRKRRRSR